MNCECLNWCSMDVAMVSIMGHHESCPKRGNDKEVLKGIICHLIRGIHQWSQDAGGMEASLVEPFKAALPLVPDVLVEYVDKVQERDDRVISSLAEESKII